MTDRPSRCAHVGQIWCSLAGAPGLWIACQPTTYNPPVLEMPRPAEPLKQQKVRIGEGGMWSSASCLPACLLLLLRRLAGCLRYQATTLARLCRHLISTCCAWTLWIEAGSAFCTGAESLTMVRWLPPCLSLEIALKHTHTRGLVSQQKTYKFCFRSNICSC